MTANESVYITALSNVVLKDIQNQVAKVPKASCACKGEPNCVYTSKGKCGKIIMYVRSHNNQRVYATTDM